MKFLTFLDRRPFGVIHYNEQLYPRQCKIILIILVLTRFGSKALNIDVGNTLNQSFLDGGHWLETKLPQSINHSQTYDILQSQFSIHLPGGRGPFQNRGSLLQNHRNH